MPQVETQNDSFRNSEAGPTLQKDFSQNSGQLEMNGVDERRLSCTLQSEAATSILDRRSLNISIPSAFYSLLRITKIMPAREFESDLQAHSIIHRPSNIAFLLSPNFHVFVQQRIPLSRKRTCQKFDVQISLCLIGNPYSGYRKKIIRANCKCWFHLKIP